MDNLAFDMNTLTPSSTSATAPAEPEIVVAPIPRITIQAFCETPEVHAAIQETFEDRRMTKATRTAQMGGLANAIEYFQTSPTPNLIILESQGSVDVVKAGLEQLAEVCDSGTRVVLIGHINDVHLYRDLMRKGVSEYVVAPIAAKQMIHLVSELFTSPDAEPVGRVVAFVGARGGVGSSTIAHNVAWSISSDLETNVVIADMDLAFGTAGLDFNQDPVQGLANAVLENDRMDEQMMERLLFRCSDNLGLLAAPATLERDYDLPPRAYDGIIELLRNTIPCTVLDVPHSWAGWTRNALLAADEVVITASPDLASLRNAKNIVEIMRSKRKHDNPPHLVLNQVGMPKRPEITSADFSAALEIEPDGIIAFDPQLFGIAANNGQMIVEMSGSAKPVEAFNTIAKLVTGRSASRRTKTNSLNKILNSLSIRKNAGKKGSKE